MRCFGAWHMRRARSSAGPMRRMLPTRAISSSTCLYVCTRGHAGLPARSSRCYELAMARAPTPGGAQCMSPSSSRSSFGGMARRRPNATWSMRRWSPGGRFTRHRSTPAPSTWTTSRPRTSKRSMPRSLTGGSVRLGLPRALRLGGCGSRQPRGPEVSPGIQSLVSGRDQTPFRANRAPAPTSEPPGTPVLLDLGKHGLDHPLSPRVEAVLQSEPISRLISICATGSAQSRSHVAPRPGGHGDEARVAPTIRIEAQCHASFGTCRSPSRSMRSSTASKASCASLLSRSMAVRTNGADSPEREFRASRSR